MILAIDPGETSGWASFRPDGSFVARGQFAFDDMLEFLGGFGSTGPHERQTSVETFVIETYTHDPGRQKRGSTFKTVQIIGAIKLRALQLGAEVVMVGREAKTMGAIYTGEEPPRNHKLSHQVDAQNLGTYWLVEQEIIDPPAMDAL